MYDCIYFTMPYYNCQFILQVMDQFAKQSLIYQDRDQSIVGKTTFTFIDT